MLNDVCRCFIAASTTTSPALDHDQMRQTETEETCRRSADWHLGPANEGNLDKSATRSWQCSKIL
jgi:hypothetical protein